MVEVQSVEKIFAITRSTRESLFLDNRVEYITSDYTEASIASVIEYLAGASYRISKIMIFNGVLHDDVSFPEKSLADVTATNLSHLISINTITPFIWISNLSSLIKAKQECHIVVLSARIGSIQDNRLGGWYAYRASKAALNMLLKTASIEFYRKNKFVKLVAFHPGTTDTPLSKPFQKNVPKEKLFTPDFVATRLLKVLSELPFDGELAYVDWDGKFIEW